MVNKTTKSSVKTPASVKTVPKKPKTAKTLDSNPSSTAVTTVNPTPAVAKNIPVIKLRPVHPGRTLAAEMNTRELSPTHLATLLQIPRGRIAALLAGRSGISIDTAHRLARLFSTTVQYWINLQNAYELACFPVKSSKLIYKTIKPVACRVTPDA